MLPHISVIIPTYNRAHSISRALNSVADQTLQPVETIVIDDGSTDTTKDMITHSFPEVIYLYQKNKGVSSARNAGIKKSTGEWIAFLDSDDAWLPPKLFQQIKALQQEREYKLCHTDETWNRRGVRVNPMKKHAKYGGFIFQRCLPLCVISPSSVVIHKSVFDEIGLFDETLPACEDYDLWLRICSKHPVLYVQEKLLIKYGGHKDQLSEKYWGMDRFRIQALEKIIASDTLKEDDRLAALSELIRKLEIYIQGARKRGKNMEEYVKKRAYYTNLISSEKL